jgi:hypothetical protein
MVVGFTIEHPLGTRSRFRSTPYEAHLADLVTSEWNQTRFRDQPNFLHQHSICSGGRL